MGVDVGCDVVRADAVPSHCSRCRPPTMPTVQYGDEYGEHSSVSPSNLSRFLVALSRFGTIRV
jgi:hypothetical protein